MQKQILAALVLATACAPRMEPVRPIQPNGAVRPARTDAVIEEARAEGEAVRSGAAGERDAHETAALITCRADLCEAMVQGRLAIGMNPDQVYTATRTTEATWFRRGDGRITVMSGRDEVRGPADAVAPIAYVLMENGVVRSWAYREPEGVRLVASPADATDEARNRVRSAALLREGDDFAARGDFVGALDRYDRADVVSPNDPETTLRIARALDKQLRPLEARMRYQLFLHQMELETIRAQGEAYAHLYAAIAEARDRIVVLDRRGR